MKSNNKVLYGIAALAALTLWTHESHSRSIGASGAATHLLAFMLPTLTKGVAASPFLMPYVDSEKLQNDGIAGVIDTMVPRIALSSLLTMGFHRMPLSKTALLAHIAWGIGAYTIQQGVVRTGRYIGRKLQVDKSIYATVKAQDPDTGEMQDKTFWKNEPHSHPLIAMVRDICGQFYIPTVCYGAVLALGYCKYDRQAMALAFGASTLSGLMLKVENK